MYIQHKPQSKICPIIYTSSSAFLKIRKEKLLTETLQHACLHLCFVAIHQLLFHNTDIYYLHCKVILGCERCHSAGAPTHNGIRIHQSRCTSFTNHAAPANAFPTVVYYVIKHNAYVALDELVLIHCCLFASLMGRDRGLTTDSRLKRSA